MNAALLRKELRELLPWGVLSIVLGTLDVFGTLFGQLDMRPLSQTYGTLGNESAVMFWFIAFAIGTGLATREQDDRTLAFLDGLPVRRSHVFLMKILVALALVMLAPLVRFTLTIVLHLLSRDSLEQSLRLDLLLLIFARHTLAMTTGLLLGAALGRLRSLTWLAFGCLTVALLLAKDEYPQAVMLDPTSLLALELHEGRVLFDATALRAQLVLCAIAGWIAWRGFTRVHRAPIVSLSLPTRPVVSAIVSILTIAVIGFGLYLLAEEQSAESREAGAVGPLDRAEPIFAAPPPAQTQTHDYRFSYPAAEAGAARELAAQADKIFAGVHALLGVPPGAVIQVDASGSAPNTHGTAHFGRIRMVLGDEAALVLAHETAHVVAQRVAGNERSWLWKAAPALNEGLATWVESRFGATDAQRAGRLALAAAHSRRELIIEEFADPEVLGQLRDENMKYPMGEAFISATVKLYGAEAVPKLLRAFADSRLPTNLRGISLWQAAYQIAGMDLSAVVDEFYRDVAAQLARQADEITQLPRPRARVVRSGQQLGVQILVDRPLHESQSLQVRFKPQRDSKLQDIELEWAEPDLPVWRHRRQIGGGAICVQPGVSIAPSVVLFEQWVCLPTADASEWSRESDEADSG